MIINIPNFADTGPNTIHLTNSNPKPADEFKITFNKDVRQLPFRLQYIELNLKPTSLKF